MTIAEGRLRDKFVGFFRLVDACEKPGCPVCRRLQFDSGQYLEALLYEQVTDPDTRKRLYGSWGFCNWHASMLPQTADPAFGSSILCEDLLRLAIDRFERGWPRRASRPRGPLGWLRRLLGGRRSLALVALFRRRAACPACEAIADSEARYLRTAIQFVGDPQFGHAYARSQGLCVPHTLRAMELGRASPGVDRLIAETLPKWTMLRRDLSDFIAKHDHRNTEPFTEAEATAYRRALEALTGASGVFGNDVHREERESQREGEDRTGGG
jgi:hypothetical protein